MRIVKIENKILGGPTHGTRTIKGVSKKINMTTHVHIWRRTLNMVSEAVWPVLSSIKRHVYANPPMEI